MEGEWKGSEYVPVLEFPYSVHTQGQIHHVSVNCGASKINLIQRMHVGRVGSGNA